MYRWAVHLSSTRAKRAGIMRIPSYALPQRAMHFSDGTGLVYRCEPTPEHREAALALLKTWGSSQDPCFLRKSG
jgi:hypothetical protein